MFILHEGSAKGNSALCWWLTIRKGFCWVTKELYYNSLPDNLQAIDSLFTFKKYLKTHLFIRAVPWFMCFVFFILFLLCLYVCYFSSVKHFANTGCYMNKALFTHKVCVSVVTQTNKQMNVVYINYII